MDVAAGVTISIVFTAIVGLSWATTLLGRRLWVQTRNADEALQRIEALRGDVAAADAREVALIAPSSVTAVLLAGLNEADDAAADAAMRAAMAEQLDQFRRGIAVIERAGLAAVLAPAACGAWLLHAGELPSAVGALLLWLSLTALGLGVGIIATLARAWLASRIRRAGIDMEKAALVVYNTAR